MCVWFCAWLLTRYCYLMLFQRVSVCYESVWHAAKQRENVSLHANSNLRIKFQLSSRAHTSTRHCAVSAWAIFCFCRCYFLFYNTLALSFGVRSNISYTLIASTDKTLFTYLFVYIYMYMCVCATFVLCLFIVKLPGFLSLHY